MLHQYFYIHWDQMKAVDYTALQVWSLIWNGRHLGIEYLLSRHSLKLSLQFLQKTPNPGDPKAFIQWFILKSLVLSLQPTVVHKSHSVLTHNLLKKWKKGRFRAKSFIFLVLVFSSSRDRIGGNGLKLPQGMFRLDMRKKWITESVIKHKNGMPNGVVESPSQKAFKHADVAFMDLLG